MCTQYYSTVPSDTHYYSSTVARAPHPTTQMPRPVGAAYITPDECTDIAAYLWSKLLTTPHLTVRNGRCKVTRSRLQDFYNIPGSVARWMQRRARRFGVKAHDIYWSWVATLLCKGIFYCPGGLSHPFIHHAEWDREVVNQSGWQLVLSARRTNILLSLGDNIKHWLVNTGGCSVLACGIDCNRTVLHSCQHSLHHSLYQIGGADTFWVTILFLAMRGDLVGDIRRYRHDSLITEQAWLATSVNKLLSTEMLSSDAGDRLLGRGKYATFTPPLPQAGQPYILDLCCGFMSIYFDYVLPLDKHKLGYVSVDWRRRMWCGSLHGWLQPHVCMDLRTNPNIVEAVCSQLDLSPSDSLLNHGSVPCTSHSTANGLAGDSGLGLYGRLGEHCPTFQSELCVARSVSASILSAHQKYGTAGTLENSGYGTLRLSSKGNLISQEQRDHLFGFLSGYLSTQTVSYCAWGFLYQKPTVIYSTFHWIPDGYGTGGACTHQKHAQSKTGTCRVHLSGYCDLACMSRIPGGLIKDLIDAARMCLRCQA